MRASLNTPSAASDSIGPDTRSWRALSIEIAAIVVASLLPFVWRRWIGAAELPAGDAWAYERIFDTYHHTGRLQFVGWNDITLVGMIPVTSLWVAVTGYGSTQLHLLGSVMCAIALLGVRSMLVTFGVTRRLSALAVLAGFTGVVGIAGTYLSDSFAIAGAVWAVALASRAVSGRGLTTRRINALVVASALAASYGFLVRQQMAVGALAAGWLFWQHRQAARHAFYVFAGVFLFVSVPIYLWRFDLADGGRVELDFYPRGIIAGLEGMFIAYGLFFFGASRWARDQRKTTRGAWLLLVGLTALAYALVCATWSYVSPSHPLIFGVQQQFGLAAGALLLVPVLAAAIAGWYWAVSAWSGHRQDLHRKLAPKLGTHPLSKIARLAIAVELAVVISTGAYFPRYSLFLACAALISCTARPLVRSPTAVLATILLAASAYWELDQGLIQTGAVMSAGRISSCLGIPPERVDATFSWDGKYYRGIASVNHDYSRPDDGLPPTDEASTFPSMQRDAVLTPTDPGQRDSWMVVGPIDTSGLIPGNDQQWWLTIRRSAITALAPRVCLDP